MLSFVDNLDIASIPQTNEEYYKECHYLDQSDLEHIVHPQVVSSLQEKRLSHHCCLDHTPFPKLIVMAEQGKIPKHLSQLRDRCPICVSYLFGTVHKQPWQNMSKISNPIWKESDMSPGAKASTDQLVSTQPGLIPQISGKLTLQCVNGATVFADHYSDHVNAYLMQDLTLEQTIAAKHGYECYLGLLGIASKGYHADNGRFTDKGFQDDCLVNDQFITFCGVGSHHQNGIAERKIKDLRIGAQTILLHAKR